MKFLDLNGLNHFWTKIKASFGTAIVESSQSSDITFVANHQIVNINNSGRINVFKWFQKASEGGILEVVFTRTQECRTYCDNFLYKIQVSSHGPLLTKIDHLATPYDTYARLIKVDATKLVAVQFVQNKLN